MKLSSIYNPGAILTLLVLPLLLAALTSCETTRRNRVQVGQPGLSLTPTSRQIYSGEIATVTAHTANVGTQNAEIRWQTTGGQLNTEQNNMVARVQFDRPGTYVVSAQLFVDGDLANTQSVTIEVLPLRR